MSGTTKSTRWKTAKRRLSRTAPAKGRLAEPRRTDGTRARPEPHDEKSGKVPDDRGLGLIARVTGAIVGSKPLRQRAREMAQQVRSVFGADACVMRLLEGEEIVLLASAGIPDKHLYPRLPSNLGLGEKIISCRRPFFVARARQVRKAASISRRLRPYHFTSYSGTPLIARGRVIGILGIYWIKETRSLGDAEMHLLRIVGDSVGAAIENNRLYEEITRQKEELEAQVAHRKRAEEAIQKLTQKLERLVTERTAALDETICRLKAEVSEHQRTAGALRESERRFHLAMEAADEGLWDRHFPSGRVYRSPSFYRMLGYEPREIPESFEAWSDLLHPDDRADAIGKANAVLDRGSDTFEAEYRFWSKDGQWHWIRSRGKVVERDADGRPVRAVGTHVDITDHKRAEAEVHRLKAELEQRVIERTAELKTLNARLQTELAEHRQTEEALLKSRADYMRLSRDRQKLLEQERARISSHLHDEFGQSLTFLMLQLARIEKRVHGADPSLAEEVKEVCEQAQMMIENVRAVARSLRPIAIEHDGLVPALHSSVADFRQISGIACRLVIRLGDVVVEEPLATVVYRIVQEALTNVARHAGASRCEIRLTASKSGLRLSVHDDGQGATAAALSGHHSLGVIGMKERASAAGGDLRVENGSRGGVQVKVRLPLRSENTN